VPLLTRMVGTPLAIDIWPGAIEALAPLLADRRISSGGHVAVAVGPGQGEEIAEILRPQLENADIQTVEGGSVEAARDLAAKLHEGFYDALVGIGGGRTLDVAKYAASLSALPLVAVATNLAHDGIASPVASLESEGARKLSYGVQMPTAVVIDLDYVKRSDASMRRSGIGDAITTAMSLYIVHEARQLGAPRHLIARMLANVALDGLVGAVPLLGDAFDVMWRANRRNMALLRKHLDREARR